MHLSWTLRRLYPFVYGTQSRCKLGVAPRLVSCLDSGCLLSIVAPGEHVGKGLESTLYTVHSTRQLSVDLSKSVIRR